MSEAQQKYLEPVRALLAEIEAGHDPEAERRLDEITRLRETSLFQEVGRLTRTLHDTLTNFQLDGHLTRFVEQDIPDARDRLSYVVNLTEQSAHRTLKAVEQTVTLSDTLKQHAGDLKQEWDRFTGRRMDVQDFRNLSRAIGEFLTLAQSHSTHIHQNLIEVLSAQQYQDITGQIIHRVMGLVRDIEDHLVNLVRLGGRRPDDAQPARRSIEAEGPQINRRRPDVVSNQDDVDALLSSLGF
jgi:chemotaxis protein CheZ